MSRAKRAEPVFGASPKPWRIYDGNGAVVSTQEGYTARSLEAIWKEEHPTRFYAGGKDDRTRGAWRGATLSADGELQRHRPTMIARSRQLDQDDPIARSCFDTLVSNVVGSGIRTYAAVDGDRLGLSPERTEELNEIIDFWHKVWIQECDYGGNEARRQNHYEMQSATVLAQARDGEEYCFPRFEQRPGCTFMFSVQFVETDRVANPLGKASNSTEKPRDVREGIAIGRRGEEEGIYVSNRHPREVYSAGGDSVTKFEYVPAVNELGRANYWHLGDFRRRGQSHSEPWLTPVLDYFRRLDDYMKSEFIGAQVAKMFGTFIKTSRPYEMAEEMRSSRFKKMKDDGLLEPVAELGFGRIHYLYPEEDIVNASPNLPTSNFEPFVMLALKFIGAGTGFPIEMVLKDFSESNFSNVRAALIEARRVFVARQLRLTAKFIEPCRKRFLEELWLRGFLPRWAPDFLGNEAAYQRYDCLLPGWQWVDPKNDAVSNKTAAEAGHITDQKIYGDRGEDYREAYKQRGIEKKLRIKYGIDEPVKALPGPATGVGQNDGEDDADAKE